LASAFLFSAVTTLGITHLLVALFYLGCVPAALCGSVLSERQTPLCWVVVLVLCTVLLLALVRVSGL